MFLPNPIIFDRPLNVWLGILTLTLLILQILVGKRIIRLPFWFHTRIIWIALLTSAIIHGLYGVALY